MGFYTDKIFPWIVDLGEPPSLKRQRAAALRGVKGEVLELGLGTGATLFHYPDDVRTLTAIEPIGGMHRIAARRAAKTGREVRMHRLAGEELPFEDGSFDTVVSVLVLCTVRDVSAVLDEAHRVLRPNGALHFLEHVVSSDPRVRRWQERLNPLSRLLACGCELIRDTERAIRGSRFRLESLERTTFRGPQLLYPYIRGIASKPA